ncbi:MAG TPA: thiamine phosphate synthase [Thermodesulfobacteriota bacterium]|nr:thiamine phosphate synthase [Thermodesulfobacteriota bacterium]
MRPGVNERLYLITDGSSETNPAGLLQRVKEALKGGVRIVQLREKALGGRRLLELALKMHEVTAGFGARLLINDRIDVTLLSGADGVHLGQSSVSASEARGILGAGKLIGVSTHSLTEARAAEADGADFVTFGPVYPTPSKACYGPPVGIQALKEVSSSVRVPVYAIGGVKKENLREVIAAGAFGAAVISAVLAGEDPAKDARELIEELERGTGPDGAKAKPDRPAVN